MTGKTTNYVDKKPARVSQPVAGFLLRAAANIDFERLLLEKSGYG